MYRNEDLWHQTQNSAVDKALKSPNIRIYFSLYFLGYNYYLLKGKGKPQMEMENTQLFYPTIDLLKLLGDHYQ